MDIKINQKNENKLLGRQELVGEIGFEKATPSYAEFTKELAAKLSVQENCVAVKTIKTAFGETKAKFHVHLYPDAESLKKIEPKIKEKKAPKAEEKK